MPARKTPRTSRPPARYAVYARCSTDEQAEGEFTTLDAQKAIAARHVQALGGTVAKTYADDGKSGTTLSRPGWKALLADAQGGAFDAVCVTYMSRLGRGDAATIAEYLLQEAGVTVASVHEQYADDEAGFVSKSVDRLVDGMYVVQVRKHTKTKMREMFDRGLVCGHVPFGYAKEAAGEAVRTKDGRVKKPPSIAVPCPNTADAVRRAFGLYVECGTAARVREFLRATTGRAWTTTQTTALLADERYTGAALFGEWRKEDAHPALVEHALWEAVQDLLPRRRVTCGPKNDNFAYYLRGRVFCPHCGSPYTYAGATGRNGMAHYYLCASVNRNGRTSDCPVRRVNAERLHLSALHHLHHVTTHHTALHKMIAASGGWGAADDTLRTLRGQLGKQKQAAEMRVNNYVKALGDGRSSAAVLAALDKAEAEAARLAADIADADAQVAAATVVRPTAARVAEGWGRLFDVWKVLTEEERTEMLGAIVERVEVTDKNNADVQLLPFGGLSLTSALSTVQVGEPTGSGGWT